MKKPKKSDYDEIRKTLLLEDINKDEKVIKRLAKKLKLNRSVKGKNGKVKEPLWFKQHGFDYLLNFETNLKSDDAHDDGDIDVKVVGTSAKKKRKKIDLYGQFKEDDVSKDAELNLSEDKSNVDDEYDFDQLKKSVRNLLNRVSESQMVRVINEFINLFSSYPRASVRSSLNEEILNLLEVNLHSKTGWLHQELAVCLACVHISLYVQFQHNQLIGYLVECLVLKIFKNDCQLSSNTVNSIVVFLSYLYRFGVISGLLIMDILESFVKDGNSIGLKSSHLICTTVGIYLRKENLSMCQNIVKLANCQLSELKQVDYELSYDLQGIIDRLSEKRSNSECVARLAFLKKQMKTWSKVSVITEDMRLNVRLDTLLNASSTGRWWVVGSAVGPAGSSNNDPVLNDLSKPLRKYKDAEIVVLDAEIEAAALNLGLRTPSRQRTFSILVSTPGGPDATCLALLRSCSSFESGSQTGSSSGVALRERETINIVLHCVMAEMPFNRFYPRILGSMINHHRRFLMTIKCAFWDIMKNSDLTEDAKSNAGRALGLICLVYDFPLTVLKNYDFGDNSDGNILFLCHMFMELSLGEYQKVSGKFMQLNAYTKLNRNCRIFMTKHVLRSNAENDITKKIFVNSTESNVKATIERLVFDMRESESF